MLCYKHSETPVARAFGESWLSFTVDSGYFSITSRSTGTLVALGLLRPRPYASVTPLSSPFSSACAVADFHGCLAVTLPFLARVVTRLGSARSDSRIQHSLSLTAGVFCCPLGRRMCCLLSPCQGTALRRQWVPANSRTSGNEGSPRHPARNSRLSSDDDRELLVGSFRIHLESGSS